MGRLLIVVFPGLPEKHTSMILEAAERHGFECHFFEESFGCVSLLAGAEVVLGYDPFLARNAPNLRWLCTPFAGVDAFTAPGVFASPSAVLTNSSGAYGVTISEHVVMVLLWILRRQGEYSAHIRNREWVRRLPVRSLYGSRITLLGTGDIGQETARRLRSFEPERLTGVNRGGKNPENLFDRVLTADSLDQVLPETDILVISLPGTGDTARMVSAQHLALLPDNAVVVNVGRGSVLDQAALEKELRKGRLFAALDVFEQEPIPPDSTLWSCPRLLITPHVAGDTTLPHTVDRIVSLFLEDFENYCSGQPLLRLVDRETGY